MPRSSKVSSRSFEPLRKNPLSLRDDESLDKDFKVFKIADKNTNLSFSENKIRLENNIQLTSINLNNNPDLSTVVLQSTSTDTSDWYLGIVEFNAINGSTNGMYIYFANDVGMQWGYDNWTAANGNVDSGTKFYSLTTGSILTAI